MAQHIEISAEVCGGKPRIAGHRIRVQDVAVCHEKLGMSPDEIVAMYPTITLADVHAALAYYFDHREEIRRDIEEERRFVADFKRHHPSKLQAKLKEQRD